MNLIFIGPQGSGKGTQARIMSEKLKIPHISAGQLLRDAKGKLKREVDSYMLEGELIPDNLMIKILKERLSQKDCEKGFILDGFPRTLEQAQALDDIAKIDNVFNIEISDEEAVKRLAGRLNCKKCGAIYNKVTGPKPKKSGTCDKCKGFLFQREDDKEEAIRTRLEVYHQDTKPLLKYYNTVKINGEQPIENVTTDIEKAIKFLTMFR